MKTPGPDHPISIQPATTRWRARFAGHVIADTEAALILQETSYQPVVYFPRADVSSEYLSRTERSTHCPYKGDAAYYTLLMDGEFAENAVWSYEQPYPAMNAIAGHLAFYRDKVEIYAVDDAAVNPHHREGPQTPAEIAAIVQHTDAGDGTTQAEHWAANVETPAPFDDPAVR